MGLEGEANESSHTHVAGMEGDSETAPLNSVAELDAAIAETAGQGTHDTGLVDAIDAEMTSSMVASAMNAHGSSLDF